MILIIDNYDSFSYNLYQLIGEINPDIKIIRNDEMTCKEIEELKPDYIVLSPGPGKPKDAGITIEAVNYFKGKVPILGVCLGHQSICEAFGATVTYAKKLMHGKQSLIKVDKDAAIFKNIELKDNDSLTVGRYHSLAAATENFPEELKVIAKTHDGEIMAVKHKKYEIYGLQFHPESILTPDGKKMISNFFDIKKGGSNMINEALVKLANGENLSHEMVAEVMDEIMTGNASDAQIASYLTAMHIKGETIEEITASAEIMRKHALNVEHSMDVIDIVGTGGDCAHTINISTIAAVIAAAGGATVAKHGNRAASSKCGTADVLEALGVNISADGDTIQKLINDTNICFLFAQKYHSAMKYVGKVRKEIKIPTIFNILGPIANPARANLQLLGVYDESLVEPICNVLKNLGLKRAMVVYGQDKLDEISISAPTTICELNDGKVTKYIITPELYGLESGKKEELVGGDPKENAEYAIKILKGEIKGAKRNAVVINAAAALHIANEITMEEGVKLAEELIDSGKAYEKLQELITVSQGKEYVA